MASASAIISNLQCLSATSVSFFSSFPYTNFLYLALPVAMSLSCQATCMTLTCSLEPFELIFEEAQAPLLSVEEAFDLIYGSRRCALRMFTAPAGLTQNHFFDSYLLPKMIFLNERTCAMQRVVERRENADKGKGRGRKMTTPTVIKDVLWWPLALNWRQYYAFALASVRDTEFKKVIAQYGAYMDDRVGQTILEMPWEITATDMASSLSR